MSSARKPTVISVITSLLCLAAFALPNTASASSAAGDFSISSNPNGVWSYGYSTTLGSALILYTSNTTSYSGLGVDGWLAPEGIPYLLYNNTSNTVKNANSTYQPGQLILQSGYDGLYSIVRWTAPSSGQFSIAATLSGLSSLGDSSEVHVLLNGTPIFNSAVIGSPGPVSYSVTTNLVVGDTVDFASGDSSDGSPNEDNTALTAIITALTPVCPNIVGTWSGQMNVVDTFRGYSTTPLSIQVTDQSTNGCLVRGYFSQGSAINHFPNVPFGWNPWFQMPFTGTILDSSTVLLNVGGDGSGKASAILDMSQTPPALIKFIYQPGNGNTLTGDLTLQPSSP